MKYKEVSRIIQTTESKMKSLQENKPVIPSLDLNGLNISHLKGSDILLVIGKELDIKDIPRLIEYLNFFIEKSDPICATGGIKW